jgi:hypothetical protein
VRGKEKEPEPSNKSDSFIDTIDADPLVQGSGIMLDGNEMRRTRTKRSRSATSGTADRAEIPGHHTRGKSQADGTTAHSTSAIQKLLATREEDMHALQQSHNKLENELYRMKIEVDRLREDRYNVHNDYEYFESRYAFITRKCLEPFAQHLGTSYNDSNSDTIQHIPHALLTSALEATSLRGEAKFLREQVQVLQREMLANLDKVQAVSDQHFEQDFRALAATIKAISRMIRPSGSLDIIETLGQSLLLRDVTPHHLRARGQKKCFLEAYVWSMLIDMVFSSPFKIFGSDCDKLNEAWKNTFDSDFFLDWPNPTSHSETWRYTSTEHLVKTVGASVIEEGILEKTKNCDDKFRKDMEGSVQEARDFVTQRIQSALALISPAMDHSHVQDIVDKSFGLALKMSLQRSRLQITYPVVGAAFVNDKMKSVPIADREELEDGVVAMVINPGLTKWGDAIGKNLEQRYDIVPAMVQLESPDIWMLLD